MRKVKNPKKAPKDSKEYQNLLSFARANNGDELAIRKLLWLINAPAHLYLLIPVLGNLERIIRLTLSKQPLILHGSILPSLLPPIKFILQNADTLSKELGAHINPEWQGDTKSPEMTKHPLDGYCLTNNPMYAMLLNVQIESDYYQNTYCFLQAHMLNSHVKLLCDESNLEKYENTKEGKDFLGPLHSSIIGACRRMFSLTNSNNKEHLKYLSNVSLKAKFKYAEMDQTKVVKALQHILLLSNYHGLSRVQDLVRINKYKPSIEFQTCQFGENLAGLHRTQSNTVQYQQTKELGVFLNRVFINRKPKRSTGSSRNRPYIRYKEHLGYTILNSDYVKFKVSTDTDNSFTIEQISETNADDNISLEEQLSGDSSTGKDIILVKYKKPIYERAYLAEYLAAQGQVRKLKMDNQLLIGRWNSMNLHEIAHLSLLCKEEFHKIITLEITPKNLLSLKAIALIEIMLWTGSSLERAIDLHIRKNDEIAYAELTYVEDEKEWRIENDLIKRKIAPTLRQDSFCCSTNHFIKLPDLTKIGGSLLTINKLRSENHLFRKADKKKYKKEISRFLRKLPEGSRVTIPRISHFLFNLLIDETGGDLTAACLITGNHHFLGRTSLYYSIYNEKSLVKVYAEAVTKVCKLINLESDSEVFDIPTFEPKQKRTYVGSEFCPSTESVQNLVHHLKLQITKRPRTNSSEDIISYHNAYTVYTQQMIAYATGIRAIKNPFANLDDIDLDSKLASISDKDGKYLYHLRIAWLPEVVIKQLSLFIKHRNMIIQYAKRADKYLNQKPFPFFFLLDEEFNPTELKPSTLTPYLNDVFPLPANVNRRYVRSRLAALGCPVEIIQSFMGHWARGEEPWSQHSSLSYPTYLKEIQRLLPVILRELKWQARKSLIIA